MGLQLSGRLVVITGASKGKGLACARASSVEGARVVGMARSAEGLTEAQQVLAADGHAMAVSPVDLRDARATAMVFARIEAAHGAVDVLVISAARRRSPDELDAAELRQAMDAKYFTCLHAIDAVIRGMAARGRGAIINAIGQGGRRPIRCVLVAVGECHADAGHGGLRQGLCETGCASRRDQSGHHPCRPHGTGAAASMRATGRDRDAVLADQMDHVSMGRPAEPEEVANVALFLASPCARYVTGAIIPMDGGKVSAI